MMRRVQVFDVNETLLDLAASCPPTRRCAGSSRRQSPTGWRPSVPASS
jgi:hypothetical protein